MRDFWAPGGGVSRMTLRRLHVLLRALPFDSALQAALRANREQSERSAMAGRRDHYMKKKAEQEGVGDD